MPASPISSGLVLSSLKNGCFCTGPTKSSHTMLPIHVQSRLFYQTRFAALPSLKFPDSVLTLSRAVER